jgi:Zn-finger nucleic acid-binding protein
MIHCPDCKLPLVTLQLETVELDYCAKEHGCWLDYIEVESLLKTSNSIFPESIESTKNVRRCPRCNARMRLIVFSSELELDVCPHGDGIWFDPKEIHALASFIHQTRGGEILDEIFETLNKTMEGRL